MQKEDAEGKAWGGEDDAEGSALPLSSHLCHYTPAATKTLLPLNPCCH